MEDTSTSLLEALRVGRDEDAWQRFLQRYEPMLCAVVRRAGIAAHDVPDVVQEALLAFLAAYRAGRYDPEQGRLRAWLRGIVMKKVLEARRRHGRGRQPVRDNGSGTDLLHRLPDEHEFTDIFEQEWERQILAECERRVQREVEPRTYEAFRLNALEDWPAEKVARHLGIERSAVYVNKNRVLSRMRRLREELTEGW